MTLQSISFKFRRRVETISGERIRADEKTEKWSDGVKVNMMTDKQFEYKLLYMNYV